MKKKILLLAGLLTLGATTFAAEGTRDLLDTFKDIVSPSETITGYWAQEFRAYTKREPRYNEDGSRKSDTRQMRLQNAIGLNLTDNLSMALRTRTYMDYPGKSQKNPDNIRFDMTYNHGNIGNTELGLSQRVRMYRSGSNAGTYSYRPNISFPSYIGADWANANLEFLYTRVTEENANLGNSDDIQRIAYDVDMGWTLGYGFSTNIEVYGNVTTSSGKDTESLIYTALLYDYNLYTSSDEATTLAFHTEASITPIRYDHRNDKMRSKSTIVNTETFVRINHNWTNNFRTYGSVGFLTADDFETHTSNVGAEGYASLGLTYSM